MNNSIYPCLAIKGRIAEAADFYIDTFSNGKKGQSMPYVIQIQLSEQKFLLLNEGPAGALTPAISFMVTNKSVEETEHLWDKLIDGGKLMMPLDTYPWSVKYGWLQDKFGVSWQIQTHEDAEQTQKICPSFMFAGAVAGRVKEAVEFYTGLFPNSGIHHLTNYGEGEGDKTNYVKHAQFNLNDYTLMAMESSGPHDIVFTDAISIVVECDSQAELDKYWDTLSTNGGREVMCGWLTDRFGISWQIIPKGMLKLLQDPERAPRVMNKVMQMKKLVLADLESA